MKRIPSALSALVAVAVFVILVYAVLRLAHVAEPAATTVHGATGRRVWATAMVLLAVGGAIVGGLAVARPTGRLGTRPVLATTLLAGGIAAVNGALVLILAKGGPGSGSGVVGGAAALVLGLTAIALGGVALARSRALISMH